MATMLSHCLLVALLCGAASAALEGATIDWSYNEAAGNGPSAWASIVDPATGTPKYPACGGSRQTPVNIVPTLSLLSPRPLVLRGNCFTVDFGFDETSFEWFYVPTPGENCTAVGGDGKVYTLIQTHVHAPSEHVVNGRRYDAEFHFVHKAADGNILVVGVFLEATSSTNEPWIQTAFQNLEAYDTPTCCTRMKLLTPQRLIPSTGNTYNYLGGLTTPPCSEIVEWWVAGNPVAISVEQLIRLRVRQSKSQFLDDRGGNARPVQRLNGRRVVTYNSLLG